jgi:hypothetical protein
MVDPILFIAQKRGIEGGSDLFLALSSSDEPVHLAQKPKRNIMLAWEANDPQT